MDPLYSAEPCDFPLLESLGLQPWVDAPKGEEYLIGTVFPREDESRRTSVQCFVTHYPAVAFRFHIVRPCVEDGEGLEEFDLECGGNHFSRYWPTALLFALGMVDVSPVKEAIKDISADPQLN
jgi:hypothetical protein